LKLRNSKVYYNIRVRPNCAVTKTYFFGLSASSSLSSNGGDGTVHRSSAHQQALPHVSSYIIESLCLLCPTP